MGASLAKWWNKMEARILLLGLDAAGKTTILYRLKLGEVVTTIPTIGFNVETIQYKHLSMTAWDVGGRDKVRPLLRHYYSNTDAIMFVIDSNDVERMDQVKEELDKVMVEDELHDSVLLIVANKQDLPNAKSPTVIGELLGLHKIRQKCHIIPTVATSGDGMTEAMEWLHQAISEKRGVRVAVKNEGRSADSPVGSESITSATSDNAEIGSGWKKAWELFKSLFIAS